MTVTLIWGWDSAGCIKRDRGERGGREWGEVRSDKKFMFCSTNSQVFGGLVLCFTYLQVFDVKHNTKWRQFNQLYYSRLHVHQVLGRGDISLLSNEIKSDQLIGHFSTFQQVHWFAMPGALYVDADVSQTSLAVRLLFLQELQDFCKIWPNQPRSHPMISGKSETSIQMTERAAS